MARSLGEGETAPQSDRGKTIDERVTENLFCRLQETSHFEAKRTADKEFKRGRVREQESDVGTFRRRSGETEETSVTGRGNDQLRSSS